jgi:transposase-like protein
MSDVDLIDLSDNCHLLTCPRCNKQTAHRYTGSVILFATTKCAHCGQEFVVAMNEPRIPAP